MSAHKQMHPFEKSRLEYLIPFLFTVTFSICNLPTPDPCANRSLRWTHSRIVRRIANYAHTILLRTRPRKDLFPLCSICIPMSTASLFEHIRSSFPSCFEQKEVQCKRNTNNTSCNRQANTEDAGRSVAERHINAAAIVVWERINTHGVELRHEGQGKEDDGYDV